MPEATPIRKESKPWKDICAKSCWFAKHEKCRCRCKKQNHGKGLQKKVDEGVTSETDNSIRS